MNLKGLLKQETGKFDRYELHYQKYAKYIPFSFVNNRKEEDIEVLEYFYQEHKSKSFDLNLKFKENKKDIVLIVVWERKR